MKYIANPVEVEARVIKTVVGLKDCASYDNAQGPGQGDFRLILEDGSEFLPDRGMTSRMTPVPGDYVVTQRDGYVYLNPKEVFERKYHAA